MTTSPSWRHSRWGTPFSRWVRRGDLEMVRSGRVQASSYRTIAIAGRELVAPPRFRTILAIYNGAAHGRVGSVGR
jgi:hypothetical protein